MTALLKLEGIKKQVDELLYKKNVSFTCELNNEEDNTPAYYYLSPPYYGGFIVWSPVSNKFLGYVLNHALVNWYELEGFTDEQILSDAPIWIECATPKEFVEKLGKQP